MRRRSICRAGILAAAALVIAGMAAGPTQAQVIQGAYNPRDDQYRVLGLVRAQAELERAQTDLDRSEQLYERQVITAVDVEEKRAAFERARVNYLQQSLAVIFASPHVTIERAIKTRAEDGRTHVRLTLRNSTGSSTEGTKLPHLLNEDLLAQLQPDEIGNVYVSLKAEPGLGGAMISIPYERRIDVMRLGEPVVLDFRLLRDTDEVVVSINYADKVEERKIFLEADASANIVAVQSTPFSQEADLGDSATFDLLLQRFASSDNLFRLIVAGLPRDVHHEFRDPDSGARLTQIRFADGETQKRLQLLVTLPQRAIDSFSMDTSLPFWALVLDETAEAEMREITSHPEVSADDFAALRAGKAKLELVPRGVGRVEVRALNLFHEVQRGDSVGMSVLIRNVGSRRLEDLWLRLDLPANWRATIEPDHIGALTAGGEQEVRIVMAPPGDVVIGDYEARLKTESTAADRRIITEDKTIRIHVVGGANWVGTAGVVALLLGLAGGIVFGGIRLVRR